MGLFASRRAARQSSFGQRPAKGRLGRITRKVALALGGTFALVLAVDACKSAPNLPMLTPAKGWTASAAAPVISAGDHRAQALWNDPCVVKNADGTYTMYATTSVDKPFAPPILPFRLVSRDGRNWTLASPKPLLQAQGGFTAIETPSVVQFRGRWHMFFTGLLPSGAKAPMAIGHALSDDGINWKFDPALRFSATGNVNDWNGYLIGEPGAVVVGDSLRVYFSAVGARKSGKPPQFQSIGVVESKDGASFSAQRQVLVPSARYPGSSGYAGYASPAAAMVGGDLHLYYSVAYFESGANPEWNQVAIAEAVSAGGTKPFVETDAPILTLRSTKWATGEILGPAPLAENDKLSMWFGGHVPRDKLGPLVRAGLKGPDFGIGYASFPLAAPAAAKPVKKRSSSQ